MKDRKVTEADLYIERKREEVIKELSDELQKPDKDKYYSDTTKFKKIMNEYANAKGDERNKFRDALCDLSDEIKERSDKISSLTISLSGLKIVEQEVEKIISDANYDGNIIIEKLQSLELRENRIADIHSKLEKIDSDGHELPKIKEAYENNREQYLRELNDFNNVLTEQAREIKQALFELQIKSKDMYVGSKNMYEVGLEMLGLTLDKNGYPDISTKNLTSRNALIEELNYILEGNNLSKEYNDMLKKSGNITSKGGSAAEKQLSILTQGVGDQAIPSAAHPVASSSALQSTNANQDLASRDRETTENQKLISPRKGK